MEVIHPQLANLRTEIADATARARRLVSSTGDGAFVRRPAQGGWSPAECIAHLNLTTEAFLPRLDHALAGATRAPVDPGVQYRPGFLASLLAWVMEPPVRMKVKTAPAFVPPQKSGADVIRDFETLQAQLAARIETASGYDVGRIKVQSPFSSRVRYNLIGAFTVILAHERRHLWQAERAAAGAHA